MKHLLVFLSFAVFSAPVSKVPTKDHKFYVSTTNIRYNAEAQTLEITLQVFIDDAEQVLNLRSSEQISLDPDSNSETIATQWSAYLKSSFALRSGETPLTCTFLGKEYKNDLMVSYIEVSLNALPQKLQIQNKLFFELFDNQKNIVHVQTPEGRKSILLDAENPTQYIAFSAP